MKDTNIIWSPVLNLEKWSKCVRSHLLLLSLSLFIGSCEHSLTSHYLSCEYISLLGCALFKHQFSTMNFHLQLY
jgi:hypothetical protein